MMNKKTPTKSPSKRVVLTENESPSTKKPSKRSILHLKDDGASGKRVGSGDDFTENDTKSFKTEAAGRKILDRKTAEMMLFALMLMLCFCGNVATTADYFTTRDSELQSISVRLDKLARTASSVFTQALNDATFQANYAQQVLTGFSIANSYSSSDVYPSRAYTGTPPADSIFFGYSSYNIL